MVFILGFLTELAMSMKKNGHKIGLCQKCNIKFYIHNHHILPKANFGNDGETIDLCPNCHTHCHVYMTEKVTNKSNPEEVQLIWKTWFTQIDPVVKVVILVVALTSLFWII